MSDFYRTSLTIIRRKSLHETLQDLPKVDLHRHLEGSLRLSTVADIGREHGVDLPSYDIEELRPYVQVTTDEAPDFHTFLEKFNFLARFYPELDCIDRRYSPSSPCSKLKWSLCGSLVCLWLK